MREEQQRRVEEVKAFAEEAVRRFDFIRSIVLIGSVARGDFRSTSDTDVLIVLDDSCRAWVPDTIDKIHEELSGAAKKFSKRICVNGPLLSASLFADEARKCNPIIYVEVKEGIAVYDRDFFVPLQESFRNSSKFASFSRLFNSMRRQTDNLRRMELNIRQMCLFGFRVDDYFSPIIFSTNLLLMGMGVEPVAPAKLPKTVDEHLVKPGLLKRRYAAWLERKIRSLKKLERFPMRRMIMGKNGTTTAKKFARELEKLFVAHAKPDILILMTDGGERIDADNADKKIADEVVNKAIDLGELEKELYDGGDVPKSPRMTRRGFLKGVVGLGLAAAGIKVGGDYLGRVVFPKYEKKKVEPVDPEVEARRKLATENFKYLAERIGGDGAWMIKELSEQYLVKPSLDELSKDYIDQNFRRYDKGPVIVGTEEFYRGVRSALDLAKEKIPEDYEDTMRLVKIIESEIELPSAARGGIWLGKYGSIVLDEEKMKTYTIPALASVISCHEKNHIKYPKYTEQQVRELDPECQKKLGIR